jgi:hypothetical protein
MKTFKQYILESMVSYVTDSDVNIDVSNLSYVGQVNAPFGILKQLFGSPKERPNNKIGWVIKFDLNSDVARIYTENVSDLISINTWDVDGRSEDILLKVRDLIKNTIENKSEENSK